MRVDTKFELVFKILLLKAADQCGNFYLGFFESKNRLFQIEGDLLCTPLVLTNTGKNSVAQKVDGGRLLVFEILLVCNYEMKMIKTLQA